MIGGDARLEAHELVFVATPVTAVKEVLVHLAKCLPANSYRSKRCSASVFPVKSIPSTSFFKPPCPAITSFLPKNWGDFPTIRLTMNIVRIA
jgi:hypothetical protein